MNDVNRSEAKRSLETLKAWSKKVFSHPELVAIARVNSPNASYNLAIQMEMSEKIARAVRWLSMIQRDYGSQEFETHVSEQQQL